MPRRETLSMTAREADSSPFSSKRAARVRVWGAPTTFVITAVSSLLSGLFVFLIVAIGSGSGSHASPVALGFIAFVCFLPPVVFYRNLLQPLVVIDDLVRIPKLIGHDTVRLSEIDGLGLVYRRLRGMGGWRLQIWTSGEKELQVRQTMIPDPKTKRSTGDLFARGVTQLDLTKPIPHENDDFLAGSRAGRATSELYRLMLERQGPYGPLATEARQKLVTHDSDEQSVALAWWSPDGTSGRARVLPSPGSPSDEGGLATGVGLDAASRPLDGAYRPEDDSLRTIPRLRRRCKVLIVLDAVVLFAFLVVTAGFLGGASRLPTGELCTAVMGHSLHPSAACNAWRHHQIQRFILPGILFGTVALAVISVQVRSGTRLRRLSREAAADGDPH